MKIIIRIASITLAVAFAAVASNCAPDQRTIHRHVYHHYYDDGSSFRGQQGVQSYGGSAEGFEPVNRF